MNTERIACRVSVDREAFLSAGRVLLRAFKPSTTGKVVITVADGKMLVESKVGGTELACVCPARVVAEMSGTAFAKLIACHHHERNLTGDIELFFRPTPPEIGTAKGGVTLRKLRVEV